MTRSLFWWLLVLKALIVSCLILFSGIGLGPDEAQYWTWSQALDLGYYSKPPGVAWLIWVGTSIFGQTEWGVRAPWVLLSLAEGYALFLLCRSCSFTERAALWTSLLFAYSPVGWMGSFFATTDAPFLLFTTLALYAATQAMEKNDPKDVVKIGLWIALGALFKWPIYLIWPLFVLVNPSFVRSRFFWIGLLISFIGLLPSLIWNLSHNWATFRHVGTTVQGRGAIGAPGNPIAFIGMISALLSPPLLFWGLRALYLGSAKTRGIAFARVCVMVLLGGSFLLSFFQKIQGNWALIAFPSFMILIGEWLFQKQSVVELGKKPVVSLSISVALITVFLSSAYFIPNHPLKYHLGWQALGSLLEKNGFQSDDFLIADTYQTVSQLSFYSPGQKRAYFLNLEGVRKNQFSYWPSFLDEQKGKNAFFIWIQHAPHYERERQAKDSWYREELTRYFDKVNSFTPDCLRGRDKVVWKGIHIFKCSQPTGLLPQDPETY